MKKTLLLLFLFTLPAQAIDQFAQDKYKGVGKQNRLTQIESYLSTFSKDYNKLVDQKMKALEKRLEELEKKKKDSSIDEKLKKLRSDLVAMNNELSNRHTEDMIKIKDDLAKAIKDEATKREALGKGLLQKILMIQKTISGFGKIKTI